MLTNIYTSCTQQRQLLLLIQEVIDVVCHITTELQAHIPIDTTFSILVKYSAKAVAIQV